MKQIFAITRCVDLAKSLDRYFRFTRGITLSYHNISTSVSEQLVISTFREIADWIEAVVSQNGGDRNLRRAICFIDLYDRALTAIEELNPIDKASGPWAAVVAMLAIAFPEVQWVLITPYRLGNDNARLSDHLLFNKVHLLSVNNSLLEILRFHDGQFITLFDPTGFRAIVRKQVKDLLEPERVAPYVPIRREVAASIDEEEAYTYFNGYTAYRFGYQTHLVCSYTMMEQLFARRPGCRLTSLMFEDLYLNFSDRPDKDSEGNSLHMSDLRKRDESFSELKKAEYRVFITVGHRHDRDTEAGNREYLLELTKIKSKQIFKPLSGTFDLWQKSGLKRWLQPNKGLAPGFDWPPLDFGLNEPTGGHSAPGRLLEIADRLIQRASRISQSANSVQDALHGATLALEAQEYLGHRTPTTSLQALALKHKLEVMAECMFYGVEYNIDVRSRINEIERDVKSIGMWFRSKTRKLSRLSAEISIVSELALRFRERNQFDEEQECLARIRQLYRHLWFEKNKWYAWLAYPTRWYIEYLLGSLRRFVVAIAIWLGIFGFLFGAINKHWSNPDNVSQTSSPIQHGFFDAIVSFLSLQPPHELKSGEEIVVWLSLLAVVLGYIHLGIFISHLYSIITRR